MSMLANVLKRALVAPNVPPRPERPAPIIDMATVWEEVQREDRAAALADVCREGR